MNKDIIIDEMSTNGYGDIKPESVLRPSYHRSLKPYQDYLRLIIPKPSTHRLATEEDKKGPKPQGYEFLTDELEISKEMFYTGTDSEWVTDVIYLVPKQTEKEAKQESILKKIEELKSELEKL